MKAKGLLSIFLLAIIHFCQAQTGKLFTVDRELSSSLVTSVFQDRNDVIWIATEDGLNRYDGSKFLTYKQEQDSLLNNLVRTLFEDSKGRFYIGFYNGLQLYNAATGTFREIPLLLKNGEKLGAHVFTMLERKNRDILVGTSGHGLFSVKFRGDSVYAQQLTDLVPGLLINSLYEDKDQNLWISTYDKGLFRISRDNRLKNFCESGEIPCNSTASIVEDKKGNVYVGSLENGLFRYDSLSGSFSPVPYPGHPALPVNTMYLSRSGIIYIGTEGQGMKSFHPDSQKILDYDFSVSPFGFSKMKVNSIIEDNSGNLWAGIYQKGVALLPATTKNFKTIGQNSAKNNFIGSNIVSAVFKDHSGTLWAGTDGDGLYSVTQDGKNVKHFAPGGLPNSVPAAVMEIYEDSDHHLWIGSYKKGMARFNKKTGVCENVEIIDKAGNPVQNVFSIREDRDRQLWIGTMGSGLFSMDLKTNEVTRYNAPEGTEYRPEANVLHNDWINCLFLSQDQKLYIGTFDGLACLDLKTKNFVSAFGTNRLLPGHIVYSVYEDQEGTVWIGTSKGLQYIDRNSTEIHTYTTENGLPGNVISGIKEDKNNNLWISTNYGISKMDLKTHSFINFYGDDGLQGNEFSRDAAFTDSEGKIYFGGINGITYFHPEEITDEGKKLDVRITDFYIHDQAVKKGMKSGGQDIIHTSVQDAGTFHLSHQDNSFTIEFSVMEFLNPERITYIYAMQDDEWITLRPGTNTVTFNKLAPGQYNFKVKAKDYNTFSEEKEIAVLISPPWYLSAWAIPGYFIIGAIICLLILQQVRNRYRIRQKMMAHIRAKEINDAKLQFFINIAHEIRTPMTLVISPLKKLIHTDQGKEHQKAYATMHRNAERILLLINQLMDIRKIDKGQMKLQFTELDMVQYIRELCAVFDEQVHSKEIDLKFVHGMEKLNVWADPRNFDKIILNLLANALKFTPEKGKVTVSLQEGEDTNASGPLKHYFEISISDTGTGIDKNALEHIFECFFQTEISKNSFNGGTGLGLYLSRSVVQLHHGIIKAENNIDGPGSRFTMRLPLGNSHLREDEMVPASGRPAEITPVALPLPLPEAGNRERKIKSKTKYRVLVADDDEEIRNYVCQELAPEYHITESANGKEALALALKEAPDLIISDIMMPEMDGIALCRKIKQHVNLNHIPVILLTAKSEEADNLEGIATGADAYIVKPFHTGILLTTIHNLIRNREMLRNNFCGNQQQEDKVQKVMVKSSDEKLLEKIMAIISKNIENPSLSVERLAREVGMSRVHLHRKTKELTNQSTRDLIRNTRLQQAANLLSDKNINISEVAFAVGFSSLATFSTAFREFYGVPPSTYMENKLKSAGKISESRT